MIINSLIYFACGIGLFLYGMKLMSDGLELSTGSRLKKILKFLTNNKIVGVFVGFIITAIIQSSTATTVMIVGFVNAGLLNLSQAVGVIIGANIGTTTTGLMFALNIHAIAPIFVFLGIMGMLFTKNKRIKHIGMAIAGFGILFLGMQIMSDAIKPINDLPIISELFKFTKNPFFGILIGLIITGIVQSSTASMGILLAVMSAGIITDLDQAIFILYGQNLGTCFTAIISSLNASKMARKAAMIHLVYNVIGITLCVIITILPLGFVDFIKGLSSNVSQQFVYVHIIINVFMAIVLLPFSEFIIKIVNMIIKGEDDSKEDQDLEYIDSKLLETPSFAVVQAYKEVERVTLMVLKNYNLAQDLILIGNEKGTEILKEIYESENRINILCGKIGKFLIKVNSKDLEYIDAKFIASLNKIIINIERVGNHAVNIAKAYEELNDKDKIFSKECITELISIFGNVEKALTKSIEVFKNGEHDVNKIAEIKVLEEIVDVQNEEYKNNNISRLKNNNDSVTAGVEFIKILTDLERISDYACNISYAFKYKESK